MSASFEQYCRERWGFTKSRATRLIEASQAAKVVPMGTTPIPNERVARELAPLKNDPPRVAA